MSGLFSAFTRTVRRIGFPVFMIGACVLVVLGLVTFAITRHRVPLPGPLSYGPLLSAIPHRPVASIQVSPGPAVSAWPPPAAQPAVPSLVGHGDAVVSTGRVVAVAAGGEEAIVEAERRQDSGELLRWPCALELRGQRINVLGEPLELPAARAGRAPAPFD